MISIPFRDGSSQVALLALGGGSVPARNQPRGLSPAPLRYEVGKWGAPNSAVKVAAHTKDIAGPNTQTCLHAPHQASLRTAGRPSSSALTRVSISCHDRG